MVAFTIRRIIQALLVLWAMSFVTYGLIGLMPGDPIDLMISADPKLTSEDIARLRALHGLDQPLLDRYWNWLVQVTSGDLGYSRLFARPVADALGPALSKTLILMGLAFVVALAIGIPAGIVAGRNPYSRTDYVINLACFAGLSTPPFWLALMLISLFSVTLGWLPATATPAAADASLIDRLTHLILPVITLGALSAGGIARHMRGAMQETLRQDYVRTALAKGLSERAMLVRHALRNAMIPVVTIIALDAGALFSGALITEIMFSYPGMGKLMFDAVMGNDFNLALAGLLLATAVTLTANLAADFTYAAIDPRVTYASLDT